MASRLEDRWLWLGLGVFFFVAAKGIQHALTDMVRLTELDPAQFPANDKYNGKHPEECVDVQTLKTLCMSPNPSIAEAARSLVIRRFAALPNAAEMLAQDRESNDPERRRKAVQAVQYLGDYDMEMGDSLRRLSLEDSTLALPEYPVEWWDRHQPGSGPEELRELALGDVTYRNADGEAAVVNESEWDAMARELNRRQDHLDNERGMDVVARLEELSEEIARTERDMGALQARLGWTATRAPIDRTDGDERRRRHREAMVLREGDGTIEEEDIIRPAASRSP